MDRPDNQADQNRTDDARAVLDLMPEADHGELYDEVQGFHVKYVGAVSRLVNKNKRATEHG